MFSIFLFFLIEGPKQGLSWDGRVGLNFVPCPIVSNNNFTWKEFSKVEYRLLCAHRTVRMRCKGSLPWPIDASPPKKVVDRFLRGTYNKGQANFIGSLIAWFGVP